MFGTSLKTYSNNKEKSIPHYYYVVEKTRKPETAMPTYNNTTTHNTCNRFRDGCYHIISNIYNAFLLYNTWKYFISFPIIKPIKKLFQFYGIRSFEFQRAFMIWFLMAMASAYGIFQAL